MYRAFISESVLGELLVIIQRDLQDFNKKYDAICKILIIQDACSIFVPKIKEYLDALSEICDMEFRCSSTDVRIASEAICSQAQKLVTLDSSYNTRDLKNQIEVLNLKNSF